MQAEVEDVVGPSFTRSVVVQLELQLVVAAKI